MALGERRSRESPWIKKLKNYLLSPGIEPTICISRGSHIYHLSTLAQVFVGISCIYVWTTTALKDWLYFPTIKSRPVVHEKHLSGSPIRISIRITPNFELVLPMIITSLLTKFHQNPTSRFWEILLTNKQTNRQTDTRRWLQNPAFRGIIMLCFTVEVLRNSCFSMRSDRLIMVPTMVNKDATFSKGIYFTAIYMFCITLYTRRCLEFLAP